MVEIADIKDRESLEAWLITQPQKTSVAIAHRAAMRVLPLYWAWELETGSSRKDGLTALPILRRVLISGVATDFQISEFSTKIKHAADSATFAFAATAATSVADDSVFAAAADTAADDSVSAAAAAAAVDDSVFTITAIPAVVPTAALTTAVTAALTTSVTTSVSVAVSTASYDDLTDMWNIIRTDCLEIFEEDTLVDARLWLEHPNPMADSWQKIKQQLAKDSVDWSFWIKWVEASLVGEPLNWEMLERIALIEPEDWEQGPAHINPMIAEIEAAFIVDALPQADKLDIDPDTGLADIIPIVSTEEQLVQRSLTQVEFARDVAMKSNVCGLNFNSTAYLYISFSLEQCRDDANAIMQNYKISVEDIRSGLQDDTYKEDPKLTALVNVLDEQILNLLANHPEVKMADRARVAHVLSLAKSDVKLKIVEELDFIKAAQGVKLKAEMALDGRLLAQDRPSEAQTIAAQRLFGRIGQMYLKFKNLSVEAIHKIDGSAPYKTARMVGTLATIVGLIALLI